MPNNNRKSVQGGNAYARLTPSLAFQLAGPHTWVAAVTPVLFSYVYCGVTYSGTLNLFFALILLAISVLMQSAVNVFNDYFDFKKGTDSLDNSSEDEFDAVLVYNNLNPRSVMALAIAYLGVAGALGIYLVVCTSWITLAIGVVGAVVVVIYSGGKTPISYLPIGEFVSGFVMGGLIPLACCYVLSSIFEPLVLLASLPCIIGIGMILFTNNCSDVEKDIEANRRTIAVVLGRENAVKTYRATVLVWLVVIIAIVGIFYPSGMPFVLLMLLGAFPVLRALIGNPLVQASRDAAMSQIVTLNVILISFYCLALAATEYIGWI